MTRNEYERLTSNAFELFTDPTDMFSHVEYVTKLTNKYQIQSTHYYEVSPDNLCLNDRQSSLKEKKRRKHISHPYTTYFETLYAYNYICKSIEGKKELRKELMLDFGCVSLFGEWFHSMRSYSCKGSSGFQIQTLHDIN